MRIHVTKTNGEQIFGALNIGKLERVGFVHENGNPVFKMENEQLVHCSEKMFERINERLEVLCCG